MAPSKLDAPPLTELDILKRSAAEILMRDWQTGAEMAGCQTDKFVQSARKAFKGANAGFSDDDIRDIHEMMRELVVRKAMGGQGLRIDPN